MVFGLFPYPESLLFYFIYYVYYTILLIITWLNLLKKKLLRKKKKKIWSEVTLFKRIRNMCYVLTRIRVKEELENEGVFIFTIF